MDRRKSCIAKTLCGIEPSYILFEPRTVRYHTNHIRLIEESNHVNDSKDRPSWDSPSLPARPLALKAGLNVIERILDTTRASITHHDRESR
jgi:hypothetical protein